MGVVRPVIVFLNPELMSRDTQADEGVPFSNAVEAIRRHVPEIVIGRPFPSMLAIHMKVPESVLPKLESFLESKKLGTFRLDEGHSLAGA